MAMDDNEQTPEQSRHALGEELNGLAGLIYRIAHQTLDPDGMHAASLAVVYEAIYLARQVMLNDGLEPHDADDLHNALTDLERKARHWKVTSIQQQVWEQLPAHLKPEGPTQKAIEYALYEWLNDSGAEGKGVRELTAEFVEFCEAQQVDGKKTKRGAKAR